MATYHLYVSSGSKASGKSAGGKARYLLREGPYAVARERVQEGSTVRAVEIDKHAELVFTESGNLPEWAAGDPLRFWDASDAHERANGSTYREVEVALPRELSEAQQIALAQAFARAVSTVEGGVTPWTLAVHQQDPAHPEHRHVHILLADRIQDGEERSPEQFFRRYNAKEPARGGARKSEARRDTKVGAKWTDQIRPLWARFANDALAHAGVSAQIDHRTLEAQRLEKERIAGRCVHSQQAEFFRQQAEALDRPPEPKKGRVLTHAGPEKAPDRARLVIQYERAKSDRQALIEARREAEREAAEIERKESILRKAQARQQERDPFDRMKIRGRWERRQKARQNRQRDAETAAEQRPGIRHPERPQWQVYRERMLTEAYNQDVAQTLGRWVKVERVEHGLHIHNRQMDLTDYGDRIVAGLGGKEREIEAMLQLARAKGWQRLELTGSALFQERAGAAALAAGFTLADEELVARIVARQEKDAEAQRIKDLEAAPILAEWMRTHPKQAQAQRLAGGKLPWACPAGLDRPALQRPEIWIAADAWTVGRHGETAAWQALSKDPDPLKAQAAAAGREAAYNAWAQRGLTLRVGQDAPEGQGIAWVLSGAVTREVVERYAGFLQDRRKRAGVDHPVTVTFGGDVSIAERVLVLEHLLRQSVSLDAPALEKAGYQYELNRAQERLNTHEPDGRQQVWYTRDLEQKAAQRKRDEVARIRADRVKKLDALALHLDRHGAGDTVERFLEAGFVRDKDGFYTYPDPDLPGVQKVWDALAAAQRRDLETHLQSQAEDLGYRAIREGWREERRIADPVYQEILRAIQGDTKLQEIANLSYQQGVGRARLEIEQQRGRARQELLAMARRLGRQAEAYGNHATKQAENQREFVKLVQRGAGLGVDEKTLSQSLQDGREAYRREKAVSHSRSRGMGL